mmetsp:Transcript_113336/g.259882  ORF Transcript_113336/g.259882 Transcript_113336/m.259882 type:complete len:526 (+) Transcript_113336:1073-2650(+)
MLEIAHLTVDIVKVAVARHPASQHRLNHSTKLPSSSRPLGMTSQPLLCHNEQGVASTTTQGLHLRVQDVAFVLVVEFGAGAVARADTDVINGQTPSGQSTTKRRNRRVPLPPLRAPALLCTAHQARVLLLQSLLPHCCLRRGNRNLPRRLQPLGSCTVGHGLLGLQCRNSVGPPLFDALQLGPQLLLTIPHVEQRREPGRGAFGCNRQDTLTRSWYATAFTICCRMHQSNDCIDWGPHLNCQITRHQDVHSCSLRLHEPSPRAGHGTAHLTRRPTLANLNISRSRRLHVCKLQGRLLVQVIECTANHNLGLTGNDALITNCKRLERCRASTDRRLDGASRRQEQHVDPSGSCVDESLLQNVPLNSRRITKLPLEEHQSQSMHATDSGANAIANLGDVHILVELKRIGNSSADQRLHKGHNSKQGHAIYLVNHIVGNTVRLRIPSCWDLSHHPAISAQSARHIDLSSSLQLNVPCVVFDVRLARIAVHLLELVGCLFIRNFNWRHVPLQQHTVVERRSSLGIIAPE